MDFDEFEELLNQENTTKEELILSVSDFIESANLVFENYFPSILIEGEISSFKINQNKYVFFDLKDGESSLSCFMTVWQMRMPLEDGMKVVVKASAKLTNWGKFSLTIQEISPRGEGSLKRSFDILKNKLSKEGLFSPEKKRKIPKNPDRLAVISSTQAAGYADFIKILNERWGGMKILVAHTQVQGCIASDQIIAAVNYFNQQDVLPEVIAIVRGGGSADDLAVFNDERLVRAIASSRIPIITGIGHETDEVLADLAADLAASTPSNAAQFLTGDKWSEIDLIHQKLNRQLADFGDRVDQLANRSDLTLDKIYNSLLAKIDQLRLENKARIKLIERYDPKIALKNGYAIIHGEVNSGEIIKLETFDKIIEAEVKNVKSK